MQFYAHLLRKLSCTVFKETYFQEYVHRIVVLQLDFIHAYSEASCIYYSTSLPWEIKANKLSIFYEHSFGSKSH